MLTNIPPNHALITIFAISFCLSGHMEPVQGISKWLRGRLFTEKKIGVLKRCTFDRPKFLFVPHVTRAFTTAFFSVASTSTRSPIKKLRTVYPKIWEERALYDDARSHGTYSGCRAGFLEFLFVKDVHEDTKVQNTNCRNATCSFVLKDLWSRKVDKV